MNLPCLVFPYQRPALWYTPLSVFTQTIPGEGGVCAALLVSELLAEARELRVGGSAADSDVSPVAAVVDSEFVEEAVEAFFPFLLALAFPACVSLDALACLSFFA